MFKNSIFISFVEKERSDSRRGGGDGGARSSERAPFLGWHERVPFWSPPSGPGTCGNTAAAEAQASWITTGDRATAAGQSQRCCLGYDGFMFASVFQGYLHMWLDMFPTDVPAPPTVDIKPRLPVQSVSHVTEESSGTVKGWLLIFFVLLSDKGTSCAWSSGTLTMSSWKMWIPSLEIHPQTSTSKGWTSSQLHQLAQSGCSALEIRFHVNLSRIIFFFQNWLLKMRVIQM